MHVEHVMISFQSKKAKQQVGHTEEIPKNVGMF